MPNEFLPELTEASEMAATLMEVYGPIASAYAMVYQHCIDSGLPEVVACHFVCRAIDNMHGFHG